MKNKDIGLILDIMSELDDNETATLEQMFIYKMNEKDDEKKEAKKVAKEYFMDQLDPTKKIKKQTNADIKKKWKVLMIISS